MLFEIYEITREYPRNSNSGVFVETGRRIAVRNETEVKSCFHNMKLGETRELSDGFEIFRAR